MKALLGIEEIKEGMAEERKTEQDNDMLVAEISVAD